jgi:hypothetical protein
MLDAVASETEQVLTDVAKEVGRVADEVAEVVGEALEQFNESFPLDLERQLTVWIEPLVDACLGLETTMTESVQPFVHTIDPILSNQPACVGCRHYHGQSYGGNLLICGMHPFGWDGETCPDWQSTWQA